MKFKDIRDNFLNWVLIIIFLYKKKPFFRSLLTKNYDYTFLIINNVVEFLSYNKRKKDNIKS